MRICQASQVLQEAGLPPPDLAVLRPDAENYEVLLLQPQGSIEASASGVRNRDRANAVRQFSAFLELACASRVALAVTPEYSLPWDVLGGALRAGHRPPAGALWALGCESTTLAELQAWGRALGDDVALLHEPLTQTEARFLDPLVYLCVTPASAGRPPRTVALVQFKTNPMSDPDHFERNHLQCGSCVYRFGGADHQLSLLTLLCSDAFAFSDAIASSTYHRALVLHLQLNPSPRQDQYRSYRPRLFAYEGDETELLCLNWAANVREFSKDKETAWKNIAGSAWYLRPDKFDRRDETIRANHRAGLYYTWLPSIRSHALFLNYEPSVFRLTVSKVAHHGVVASESRRRGPLLTQRLVWSDERTSWEPASSTDDGFPQFLPECGAAQDSLRRVADICPLAAERVLALSGGYAVCGDDWFAPQRIDSCTIEPTEVVRRMTFCQDTDQGARQARVARLRRCGHLWDILTDRTQLPPALSDLATGYRLAWSADAPHQNIVSGDGRGAAAIYLGEEVDEATVERVAKESAERLHRSGTDGPSSDTARQRLAVWYREPGGGIRRYDSRRYNRFDDGRTGSEFDITRDA